MQSNGRPPTFKEMADFADRSVEEVAMWQQRIQPNISLDRSMLDDGNPLMSTIADETSNKDVYSSMITEEEKSSMAAALTSLNERERSVITRYFMEDDLEGTRWTNARLAKHLGISRERTRQIRERAIVKLKQHTTQCTKSKLPLS